MSTVISSRRRRPLNSGGGGGGQAGLTQQGFDARHGFGFEPAQIRGKTGGHEHAAGHGLPMQPAAIAQAGFYGVAEGMA